MLGGDWSLMERFLRGGCWAAGEMFLPGEHVEHWTQPLPASGEGWAEDRGPRMTTAAPAVNWS